MIPAISGIKVQSFQGRQQKAPQKPETSNEKQHNNSLPKKVVVDTAVVLALLTALSGCGKDAQKKPENPTTSQSGYNDSGYDYDYPPLGCNCGCPNAGVHAQLEADREAARQEYEESVRASEAQERADYENWLAEDRRQQEDARINANGLEYYVNADLSDPVVKDAYYDIKNVLQNIGSEGIDVLVGCSEKYELSPTVVLALFASQGGVPKLSDMALEDVLAKYPELENASKMEKAIAFFGICVDREDGNYLGGAKRFTGNPNTNLLELENVASDIASQWAYIAENDVVGMARAE